MARKKKLSLTSWIIISLVLGILVGLLFQKNPSFTTNYLKPIGNVYISLLKFLVAPVVLCSIVSGIISLKDLNRVKTIGLKALWFYLVTTVIAIFIGLALSYAFKSFFHVLPNVELSALNFVQQKTPSFVEVLSNIFPNNFIAPLLQDDMLPVILIALLLGYGILKAKDKSETITKLINEINEIMMQMMSFIISLTPVGCFCLMADVVAVNGPSIIGSLTMSIGVVYLGLILHVFLVYFPIIKYICNMSPIKVFKGLYPALLCAFTTASSNAALPLNMECCNKLGAEPEVTSFVLPLGSTVNMDGTAIYQVIATFFIASCFGIELSFSNVCTIVVFTILASISTAGIAGSGMVMLAMILSSVGIPVEGIAIIAGVDKLFNMGRSAINITGDAICALWISEIDREKAETVE